MNIPIRIAQELIETSRQLFDDVTRWHEEAITEARADAECMTARDWFHRSQEQRERWRACQQASVQAARTAAVREIVGGMVAAMDEAAASLPEWEQTARGVVALLRRRASEAGAAVLARHAGESGEGGETAAAEGEEGIK